MAPCLLVTKSSPPSRVLRNIWDIRDIRVFVFVLVAFGHWVRCAVPQDVNNSYFIFTLKKPVFLKDHLCDSALKIGGPILVMVVVPL